MPSPSARSSWRPDTRLSLAFSAFLAGTSACTVPSPFGCADDSQCQLDGAAGMCAADHCAYPDAGCVSGWSYPVGAGAGLGGQCADGGPPIGSTATTVDTAGDGSSSTASPESKGTTEAATSGSTTDGTRETEATGATPDPVTTETTGGSACADPSPNDGPEGLPAVPLDQDCSVVLSGEVDDTPPADDWFSVGVPADCASQFGVALEATLDTAGVVCLFSDCVSGVSGVTCGRAQSKVVEGELEGCCNAGPGTALIYGLSCDVGAQFWVRASFPVSVEGDVAQACAPYTVAVVADD